MRILSTLLTLFFCLSATANNEYIIEVNDAFLATQTQPLSMFSQNITQNQNKFVANLSSDDLRVLKSDSNVINVYKNLRFQLFNTPDDLGENLWGLENPSKADENFDINVIPAWAITTGSEKIVVAVTDTGAMIDHTDLKDNLWMNEAELNGIAGEDDDGNGYVDDIYGYDFPKDTGTLGDRVGHGTHVSGTIGAQGNNGTGVVGVNWDVSLMTLNIFPDRGSATLDKIIDAIKYAADNGAHVINASWGGPAPDPNDEEAIEAYEQLKQVIKEAGDAGVLFVAAAGNSGNDSDSRPLYPAAFDLDNIISVGSMTSTGRRSFFSNYGKVSVDVFAPGSNIVSTTNNGRTGRLSGTSMASPHVAGIAALLLSVNEEATWAELKDAILSTCTANNAFTDRSVCGGHVDTHAALLKIQEIAEQDPENPDTPEDPENPEEPEEITN